MSYVKKLLIILFISIHLIFLLLWLFGVAFISATLSDLQQFPPQVIVESINTVISISELSNIYGFFILISICLFVLLLLITWEGIIIWKYIHALFVPTKIKGIKLNKQK